MADKDTIDAQPDGTSNSPDQTMDMHFTEKGATSDIDLMEPTTTTAKSPNLTANGKRSSSPLFMSQDEGHDMSLDKGPDHLLLAKGEALRPEAVKKRGLAVVVPPVQRPWEYLVYKEPKAREIVEVYDDGEYLVQFEDEWEEVVSQGTQPLLPLHLHAIMNSLLWTYTVFHCVPEPIY
jgi:hypothetical protein